MRISAEANPPIPPAFNKFFSESRALFCIVTATVLVYANSLSGAFVFDDTKQIVGNPALRSWGNVFRAFTSDVWSFQRGLFTKDIPPPYYRPLFTAYLTLNYQLFGLREPYWHLMNLLVHVGASILVYYLLRQLSRPLSNGAVVALVGALLFGVHPAHVESVSWISGIPDPLAALFYVPSLLWYLRYREEGDKRWLGASVVAYGLSALCKETPLALPLVLVVWELSRARAKRSLATISRQMIPHLVPYAAMAVIYLVARFSVLGRISWKHPFMAQVPDSAIWMTVPYVFVSYLKHLIAPFCLSLIYGTSFVTSGADPRFLLPAALLLVLAALLWVYRAKVSADVWVALALMVAPLLPVLDLKVFHYEYIIQDRYLYLPSIGFCYLVGLLIPWLARRRAPFATALAGLLVIGFGAGTMMQNRVWHDSVSLWWRAVYYAPDSWSIHYNLGLAYLQLKQSQAAIDQLTDAQRLNPNEATVLNNLGLAYGAAGDKTKAIQLVREALEIDPTLSEAHNNLGTFLFDEKDLNGARLEFTEVLARDPSSSSARFNLARTLAAMGDHLAAIREYESLLAIKPEDLEARYELSMSYAATGQSQKADEQFNQAASIDFDPKRVAEMRKKLSTIKGAK